MVCFPTSDVARGVPGRRSLQLKEHGVDRVRSPCNMREFAVHYDLPIGWLRKKTVRDNPDGDIFGGSDLGREAESGIEFSGDEKTNSKKDAGGRLRVALAKVNQVPADVFRAF